MNALLTALALGGIAAVVMPRAEAQECNALRPVKTVCTEVGCTDTGNTCPVPVGQSGTWHTFRECLPSTDYRCDGVDAGCQCTPGDNLPCPSKSDCAKVTNPHCTEPSISGCGSIQTSAQNGCNGGSCDPID